MALRAIIVDDEDLARRGIRTLLERAGDVEIVGECRNGREAIDAIREAEADLLYLDIQMPGRTGFDVIDSIGDEQCPYIIFVTAFEKFALQAFEVHAFDYLLKPVNEMRFNEALERARAAVADVRDSSFIRRLAEAAAELRRGSGDQREEAGPDRIAVRSTGRVSIVPVADIDWVEADHDYVSLHVGTKSWLHRETIAAMETRLSPAGFVRIHRSTLVNVTRVRELRPLSKGEFTVALIDGTELKLSRNYRASLQRLIGETR